MNDVKKNETMTNVYKMPLTINYKSIMSMLVFVMMCAGIFAQAGDTTTEKTKIVVEEFIRGLGFDPRTDQISVFAVYEDPTKGYVIPDFGGKPATNGQQFIFWSKFFYYDVFKYPFNTAPNNPLQKDYISFGDFNEGVQKSISHNQSRVAPFNQYLQREYYFEHKVKEIRIHFNYRKKKNSSDRHEEVYSFPVGGVDPCQPQTINTGIVNGSLPVGRDINPQSINFRFRVIPLPGITRGGSGVNIAGFNDPMRVNATGPHHPNVYHWKYRIEGEGGSNIRPIANAFRQGDFANGNLGFVNKTNYLWIDIPTAPNRSIFDLRPSDFLGGLGNEDAFLDKTIIIGAFSRNGCDSHTVHHNFTSFRIVRSAPYFQIERNTPVTCKGGSDGEVSINFTPFKSGDQLNFTLHKKLASGIYDTGVAYSNITPTGTLSNMTFSNLPAGEYKLGQLIGKYIRGGVLQNFYSDGEFHTLEFTVREPDAVTFEREPADDKTDVWCFDGADGEILLTATGGVGGYQYLLRKEGNSFGTDWVSFTSGTTHSITGLEVDTYYMKLRDINGCIAKDALNNDVVKQVTINKPDTPVDVEVELINQPRAFGFEDGRISARIFNGTPFTDGTYTFVWKNERGDVLNTAINTVLSGDQGYQTLLHSVGAGVYTLDVFDANFNPATDKKGCFVTNIQFNLQQPEPLEVTIEVFNLISCHIENEYSDGIDFIDPIGIADQFQDGALIATVTGGVPFDKTTLAKAGECRENFSLYCYRWKKNVGGVWQDIADNDEIIEGLSVGTYALNVEDANGIVLGTYEEYTDIDGSREYRLIQAVDSTKYLAQPDKLEISFQNTEVTCASGGDATAKAVVTGGTKPYTYQWSNGETTSTINNLIAGTYLVFVIDAKGCEIEGRIKIDQPNGIEITPISVISPTCFGGNDGSIRVDVEGGSPPYRYRWNTGSTSSTNITNLSSGIYSIEVTDSKGCKAIYEEILKDSDPVVVRLENKRTLCKDQSFNLDITIDDPGATYSWSGDNGFTSSNSKVELNQSGRYIVTITNSIGCVGVGEIEVEVTNIPIDSDFLITTQAYTNQEVILVNISEPIGETIEWTIPEGVEVVSETEDQIVLVFDEEGSYDVILRSTQGDCYQDFTRTVLVQPTIVGPAVSNSENDFIEEFIVFPNPNGGNFQTKIGLTEESNVTLKIISLMSGAIVDQRVEGSNIDFLLDYSLALPTGVYLMLLETPRGSETRKLVFE
ncbi:T9SS type A sorting domain-containing protein [Aquimarina megaterium]|uniref:T9SS type A sorting domain-containing protein n=1 Tax=Aquimarina megaterium TaxID=1443666 RepID=UPI000943454D|nr:T9SS type A sorting domain-containing protein [Aquimarina megaterium]